MTTERLALAFVVSAGVHALALANLVFAPGPARPGAGSSDALDVRIVALAPEPAAAKPAELKPAASRPEAPAAASAGASGTTGLPATEVFYRGSELDQRAVPLNDVQLEYPESALQARIEGAVILRVFIGHDGAVRRVEVVDSLPAGVFEEAALKAVSALRFRPARRSHVAVASVKTIEVPFHPDCTNTGSCISPQAPNANP